MGHAEEAKVGRDDLDADLLPALPGRRGGRRLAAVEVAADRP